MTVVPWRLNNLAAIFGTLSQQTCLPDHLYVHIPRILKRKQMKYPPLPQELLETAQRLPFPVTFNPCEDEGPITKLYPVLELEQEPETILLLVDDDTTLHANKIQYIKQLYQSMQFRNQNAAFSGGGWIIGNLFGPTGLLHVQNAKGLTEVSVLQGHDGFALKRKYLDNVADLLNYALLLPSEKLQNAAKMHDDVWISCYLERKNVTKYVHPGCPRTLLQDHRGLSDKKHEFLLKLFPLQYHLQQQGFFQQPINCELPYKALGFRMWLVVILLLFFSALILLNLLRHSEIY